MRKTFVAAFLLAIVVISVQCVSGEDERYVRDGTQYGVTHGVFHGRWWNYYERGRSFLSGEFYAEAEQDFLKALQSRKEDSWQARTYGLHFEEYFPNRELGITYYRLGQIEEAEDYLRRSLDQVDTARAHHFLSMVTREKISRGHIQDVAGPAIATSVRALPTPLPPPPVAKEGVVEPEPVSVTTPASAPTSVERRVYVSERTVPVEISVSDDVGVTAVKVNNEELPQRGTAEKITFRKDVVLPEGDHKIEVAARDLADKDARHTKEVTVDLTGPTVGIFIPIDPTVTEQTVVELKGASVDKNGIASVALDERVLAEPGGETRVEFEAELLLTTGENSFLLMAKDVVGNETRSAIKVFHGDPDSFEARLWKVRQSHPELMQLASLGGRASIGTLVKAVEMVATGAVEDKPVRIELTSPSPDRPYRHNKTVRVRGKVVAETAVQSIEINGQAYDPLIGAPKEVFDKRIALDDEVLKAGQATIHVAVNANDDAGHTASQEFDVFVQPIFLDSRDSKMPLAVLPFQTQVRDLAPSVVERLRLEAESMLLSEGRFRVLDRTQLEAVLTEQQLAQLADPSAAIQLARIVNAQAFVVGEVFRHDQKGVEIKARAISTETSDVVATLDTFIEDADDAEQIERASRELAAQLEATFPRLSGELLAVRDSRDGQELLVDWSAEDGVKEGMYVLVVHQTEPWIEDGVVLEEGEIIQVGRARIERVLSTSSKAQTVPVDEPDEGVKLEKGMAAVTM